MNAEFLMPLPTAYAAMKAKDGWMERCGECHLPRAIVRAINSRKHPHLCANYLHNHGYREHIQNGWSYFVKDGLYLGAFRHYYADGKLHCEGTVFPKPIKEVPEQFRTNPPSGVMFPAYDDP